MAQFLNEKITELLLPAVEKPSQYLGGEINQVRKSHQHVDVTVALAFPDTYAIGASHLGLAILYEALNRMPHVLAERVYCPWFDAAQVMRRHNIPLFSWESHRALREFDIIGITLQHELTYSNVLFMLDLAGIPLRADQRTGSEPLIIGGGPMADCCEPIADFFDLFLLGDGEEFFPSLIDAYRQLRRGNCSRREMVLNLARQFDCIYAPQFYHCQYNADGTLAACQPTESGLPTDVQRAQVADLDNAVFPLAPLVPYTETVHDRIAIEIMRGCPQRCAFCLSGHTKGRVRCRSVDNIVNIAWQSYLATGHDTVSLLSLSTSDYPHLSELLHKLYEKFEGKHVGISLPSLRVDKQLHEVPAQVTGVRREGLTIAVEAASDRLRLAMGKHLTDTDLLATIQQAYQAGWRSVKLYFIVGFPGETPADIEAIVDLAHQISQLRRPVAGGPAQVNATVSWLVPKPHTPLAWCPQQNESYFINAQNQIIAAKHRYGRKGSSSPSALHFKFHHLQRSLLEAVLARGDRRLSRVLEIAYQNGACFDSWDECFNYQLYLDAFSQCHIDPAFYAKRPRGPDEVFPWDHLAGAHRPQLYHRYQKILQLLHGHDSLD